MRASPPAHRAAAGGCGLALTLWHDRVERSRRHTSRAWRTKCYSSGAHVVKAILPSVLTIWSLRWAHLVQYVAKHRRGRGHKCRGASKDKGPFCARPRCWHRVRAPRPAQTQRASCTMHTPHDQGLCKTVCGASSRAKGFSAESITAPGSPHFQLGLAPARRAPVASGARALPLLCTLGSVATRFKVRASRAERGAPGGLPSHGTAAAAG